MSRAFVKDNDEAAEEPVELPRKPASGAEPITPEGFRALGRELDRLWHGERPKITEEVAAAAAQGDRSENAEYIYGKKKLREIDRRIRFLSQRMEAVRVVEPARGKLERVAFGAWFTIEDETGERASYRIVGTDEIDLDRHLISVQAPVAKAVLGKRLGDIVVVQRPRGAVEVELVALWPDDEGAPPQG